MAKDSESEPEVRVAIVEDDRGVREGLSFLVDGSPGLRCVGAFGEAEGCLAEASRLAADVVLMDIDLPGISGIEATRELRRQERAPLVVMLTVYGDDEQIFHSLRAGACGYLLKTTPPAQLVEAITSVVRGGSPMSEAIARRVVASFQQPTPQDRSLAELTRRESEVLDLLSRGYRYREIGDRLHIGLETVRTHIRHIYDKLEVRSRTEATAKYLGGSLP
ncbi:MAG: response regulator transcription factor [Acidobacteriota bacterium]